MQINLDILKTRVYYGLKTNNLDSEEWEKIMCDCLDATHIPGDKYLADGVYNTSNLNIKTVNFKPHIRKNTPSRDFISHPEHFSSVLELVQRRVGLPHLNDMIEDPAIIGKETIDNFKKFEAESFAKFKTTDTKDIIVRHGIDRTQTKYIVDVFIEDHIHPVAKELEWRENLHGPNSKYKGRQSVIGFKDDKKIVSRNSSGTGRQQNCYIIHRSIERFKQRETIILPIPKVIKYDHKKLLEEILSKSVDA